MRVLYVLRDQIFKFKSRCFNILCYYCDIYNTKKFSIRIVKIVLIYNLQKKNCILFVDWSRRVGSSSSSRVPGPPRPDSGQKSWPKYSGQVKG